MMQRATVRTGWVRFFLIFSVAVGYALSTPDAYAQLASVRGFVTDADTEQALQGASVVLRGADGTLRGAATDGDGYFILNRVPQGRYTLQISFIGYASYEEALDLSGGGLVQRSVALAEQEAGLDEVVVEAEAEAGVTAVAAGLESVVPAQIERVPIPGVTGDLAAYLQTVPGVTVQGDRGGLFFVRGGALDQNLALLDGMPVYMPFHVLSFYSTFPEELIDEADVYTGGFGARYGSRISSVMDVRARNGNKQKIAGSLSLAPFLSTARLEGPIIKDRVSVIASARQSIIEDIVPSIFGQELPYRFGDLFGKVHTFINPNHSFSFTGLYTNDRGDIAGTERTFEGDEIAVAADDSSEVAWDNLVFGGRYVYLPSFLPLLAEFEASRSEMTNEVGPSGAPERSSDIQSTDLGAHFTYFVGDNEIHFGATRRTSTLGFTLGGQFEDVPSVFEEDLTEIDAYLDADIGLASGRLRVQPGVHLYSLPDRSEQWFDPRFRLNFRPGGEGGRVQFNGAFGIYHQAIAGLNDERDIGNLFTAWLPTPEGTDVPEAMHAIAGVNVRVRPWLTMAAEGFYKDFKNLSVPIFSAFPSFTTALQSADGFARGIDLRLDLRDRPFWYESVLDGYVSYALSEVEYEAAQVTYNPGHDRRHQLNALLHAQRGPVGLTVQFQYGSGLPFTESGGFDVWILLTPAVDVTEASGQERIVYNEPFRGRQPTYSRLDIWIERRIDRGRSVATLRAGVVNAFNRENLFYYDLFTFRRVDQLPLIPSVGLKVELR